MSKQITVEEINQLIQSAYTAGYNAAVAIYEPRIQSKREQKIKEKILNELLKMVKKK